MDLGLLDWSRGDEMIRVKKPRLFTVSFGRQTVVMCLIGSGLGTAPLLAQGKLEAAALRAKAKGESKVTLISMGSDEGAALSTAEEFLSDKSVMLVTIGSVQVARSDSTIYTWHSGRLERMLRTAPVVDAKWCSSLPKPRPPFLKPTDVAIGEMGGTTTISDVAVTVQAGERAEFANGSQVLVVGLSCGTSEVVLLHGDNAAFDVSASRVLSHRGERPYPFVSRLIALKTLQAIEKYLRTIK